MSTYYSLTCDVCYESVKFVSVGSRATWMDGSPEHLLPFLTAHITHHRSIRVVSEDDQWFESIERAREDIQDGRR